MALFPQLSLFFFWPISYAFYLSLTEHSEEGLVGINMGIG